MEKLVINEYITKEKEGTYYSIPFEVPENVDSFSVTYSYEKKGGSVLNNKNRVIVDLGISDNKNRFIGWSGSARNTIKVGEFESTEGYFSEKIEKGTWYILVGAYLIKEEGLNVKYEITFNLKCEKLLYGDMHCHSTASDGKLSIYELSLLAKKKKLDFLAVANHNNYSENYNLPVINGLTFIHAVEWTHYNGHMNFYGIKAPFVNSFIANSKEEMLALIDDAKKLGATISVNHPKCPFCPYLWGEDDAYSMMEIWNGIMRKANKDAIEFWTSQLKQGRVIPGIGGSDFHKPKSIIRLANPVNGVYSPSNSETDILDSIKKGHVFVSRSVNSPKVDLKCCGYRMGDVVKAKKATVEIITNKKKYDKLYVVTDKGSYISDSNIIDVEDVKFVYVIIKRFGIIETISNPIYFN